MSDIHAKLLAEMPAFNPNTNANNISIVYPSIDMFGKEDTLGLIGTIREIKTVGSDTKVAIDILGHEATVLDVFANRSSDQFFRACSAGGHPKLNKIEHVESVLGRACAVVLGKNPKRSIGYDVNQIRIDLSKQTQPVIEPASQEIDEDLQF